WRQGAFPDAKIVMGGWKWGGEGNRKPPLPTGPTVWETFKDTSDIFLDPPVKPSSFDSPEIIPPQCKTLALADPVAARRTLTMTAKASDLPHDFQQASTLPPLTDPTTQR